MLHLDAGSGARLFPGCAPTHAWDGDAARWPVVILAWRIVCKPPGLAFPFPGGNVGILQKDNGFILLP